MTGTEILAKINSADSTALFEKLYGPEGVEAQRVRYRSLAEATLRDFPETEADLHLFTAAGRTELGGNHTDHNHGKVLAASIQLDAVAFVSPRKDNRVIFRSTDYPDVVVDISETAPIPGETGTTEALVRGIAAQFTQRRVPVRGFTANANSTVLSGSGLSSSAAVEVLFGTIFDGLYGGGKRSAVEIAQMGQKAENLYFGKPCGLMDQVASASGGAVAIDFADPARPVVQRVNFDLASAGYALCVVDTGGSHADLTADYAAVPSEMKAVAQLCGGQVLRDISKETLFQRSKEIRSALGDRALLRALHFLAENERVSAMLAALEDADSAKTAEEKRTAIDGYLDLVNESGNSSWELLQNVFTPKNPKEQGVSVALAMTGDFLRSLGERTTTGKRLGGAYRVHGGGFAGTIQAYIPQKDLDAYIRWMGSVFGPQAVTVLRIRPIGAAELRFF